jgi:excisionase family DNA binding protein
VQRKQFLAPGDVAAELGIRPRTVIRMIHKGELPAIRVSERTYRIPAASFEMYKVGMLQTIRRPSCDRSSGSHRLVRERPCQTHVAHKRE